MLEHCSVYREFRKVEILWSRYRRGPEVGRKGSGCRSRRVRAYWLRRLRAFLRQPLNPSLCNTGLPIFCSLADGTEFRKEDGQFYERFSTFR
jgi:hypothetical protein